MRFIVIPNSSRVPSQGKNIAYLWTDSWNDWWKYNTLYVLTIFDSDGQQHDIGGVKIGQFAWKEGQSRPDIPTQFESLDNKFFSLGQDVAYYERLRDLSQELSAKVLESLNDVAANETLFLKASNENVMGESLMRSVADRTIREQFKRIIDGGTKLTSYAFEYCGPKQLDDTFIPVKFVFSVEPFSKPPTNIQVIIGRNGVGKSFYLNAMSRALVAPESSTDENGKFSDTNDIFGVGFSSPFANLVSVTFSAFDDFPIIRRKKNALAGLPYSNIGLRKLKKIATEEGKGALAPITQEPNDLATDFIDSAKLCAFGERSERWLRALKTLESDPIFEEAQIAELSKFDDTQFSREAGRLFRRLSSGHKIVLLTITKLVEKVSERTLVLLDEPEAHLHPPLLSALVRALSDLLISRNGVAIVATHSPVVLQEVPKSCVWKLIRHGGGAKVERPKIETFAETIGQLTHEIFGLEVVRSGFHKILADSTGEFETFSDVLSKFDNEIGSEGRALISSLIALRDAPKHKDGD